MKKVKSILIAEARNHVFSSIHNQIKAHFNYPIIHCHEQKKVLEQFKKNDCLICVVDTNILQTGSFDLIKKIRYRNELVPIVLIAGPTAAETRIKAFINGADAFLERPVAPELLNLRIAALLNRLPSVRSDKTFNMSGHLFSVPDKTIKDAQDRVLVRLSPKGAELLAFFLSHAGITIRREEILYNVWGKDDFFNGRSMDVVVAHLRKYLSTIDGIELETIHGVGFKFTIKQPNGHERAF